MWARLHALLAHCTALMFTGVVFYGIIGLSLGAGSLGLDYFLASTRLNFGG